MRISLTSACTILLCITLTNIAAQSSVRRNLLCGPQSLFCICESMGVEADLAELKELTGFDKETGTTMLGLKKAAEAKGLCAVGVKIGVDQLVQLEIPAIAHLWGNHFVVVEEGGPDTLKVTNPPREPRIVSKQDFAKSYSGFALLVARDESAFEDEKNRVRIYKLHGSLAWYRDPDDHNLYSRLVPAADRELVGELDALLVFGTPNKLQAVDPFLFLSHTFSERVRTAKVVAIVGYGFADDYINQILEQGLTCDSRKQFVVLGKSKTDAERTLRANFAAAAALVDAGWVRFVTGGAKVALNDGTLLNEVREAIAEATETGPF